jgi:hypothetical protein
MGAWLEVWDAARRRLVALASDRVSLGKHRDNDVVLEEPSVSRLHAVLERMSAGWCIHDLGSKNGTFVNGERVFASQVLRAGDEVRLGSARLVFGTDETADATMTGKAAEPPPLTVRERDVLVALCRPLLAGDLFCEPSSTREIAAALFVSEAAVKQHLAHLYGKFGIYETGERRRMRLANEALARGAVTLADLR